MGQVPWLDMTNWSIGVLFIIDIVFYIPMKGSTNDTYR